MKKNLLAILFLLLTSNFAYAEEKKSELKKEEKISTKNRFAIGYPLELKYHFNDDFSLSLVMDMGYHFSTFKSFDKKVEYLNTFNIKPSMNISNTIFKNNDFRFFLLTEPFLIELSKYNENLKLEKIYIPFINLKIGAEVFLTRNISVKSILNTNILNDIFEPKKLLNVFSKDINIGFYYYF